MIHDYIFIESNWLHICNSVGISLITFSIILLFTMLGTLLTSITFPSRIVCIYISLIVVFIIIAVLLIRID